jgi:hypothetical protein
MSNTNPTFRHPFDTIEVSKACHVLLSSILLWSHADLSLVLSKSASGLSLNLSLSTVLPTNSVGSLGLLLASTPRSSASLPPGLDLLV